MKNLHNIYMGVLIFGFLAIEGLSFYHRHTALDRVQRNIEVEVQKNRELSARIDQRQIEMLTIQQENNRIL